MVQKKNRFEKCLYYHSEWKLTASIFLLAAWLKWHGFSTSAIFMPYSKLYILAERSANDVKFIPVDRPKLDLLKYIYTYGTVNSKFREIQPDSTNIKNDPRTCDKTVSTQNRIEIKTKEKYFSCFIFILIT